MWNYLPLEPINTKSKVPIDFAAELYEWLKEASHRRRRPMSELVRDAVREYRDRVDPQLRLPITARDE